MDTAICPHCNQQLDLGDAPQVGQHLLCPACLARLEIISARPPEVDWQFLEPGLGADPLSDFAIAQTERL